MIETSSSLRESATTQTSRTRKNGPTDAYIVTCKTTMTYVRPHHCTVDKTTCNRTSQLDSFVPGFWSEQLTLRKVVLCKYPPARDRIADGNQGDDPRRNRDTSLGSSISYNPSRFLHVLDQIKRKTRYCMSIYLLTCDCAFSSRLGS